MSIRHPPIGEVISSFRFVHLILNLRAFNRIRARSSELMKIISKEIRVNKPLLTTAEAAKFLGVSDAFLERDRWAGARIPFIKVGSRAVRYRQTDLDVFIQSRTRQSTSQY